MKRLVILVALMVTSLLSATAAFAQPPTGFSQTATATAFTPIPGGSDGYGVVGEGGFGQGVVSGSPINGTFSMQEMRSHSADGSTGSLQGQFTMTDGAGNSISGSTSGSFTTGASGSNALGQYAITGGTGAYSAVSGSGSFSEAFGGGGAPTLNFGGTFFNSTAAINPYSTYNPYVFDPNTAVTNLYVPSGPGVSVLSVPNFIQPAPYVNPVQPRASCASQAPRDQDPSGSKTYSVTGELCSN